jgi:transposase
MPLPRCSALPRSIDTVSAKRPELTRVRARLGATTPSAVDYEAGPCGYTLARDLAGQRYYCDVIAPAKILRQAGDRVTTNRRGASRLAHFARARAQVPVVIPDARDEAIRDLSRTREDAVRACLKSLTRATGG